MENCALQSQNIGTLSNNNGRHVVHITPVFLKSHPTLFIFFLVHFNFLVHCSQFSVLVLSHFLLLRHHSHTSCCSFSSFITGILDSAHAVVCNYKFSFPQSDLNRDSVSISCDSHCTPYELVLYWHSRPTHKSMHSPITAYCQNCTSAGAMLLIQPVQVEVVLGLHLSPDSAFRSQPSGSSSP